jgi:hypothetical protein
MDGFHKPLGLISLILLIILTNNCHFQVEMISIYGLWFGLGLLTVIIYYFYSYSDSGTLRDGTVSDKEHDNHSSPNEILRPRLPELDIDLATELQTCDEHKIIIKDIVPLTIENVNKYVTKLTQKIYSQSDHQPHEVIKLPSVIHSV